MPKWTAIQRLAPLSLTRQSTSLFVHEKLRPKKRISFLDFSPQKAKELETFVHQLDISLEKEGRSM
ncbi:MAG: hypothetical protein CME32_21370 [Gimesia sp.]|nr:hypothetical protein [Gimesia sp.]